MNDESSESVNDNPKKDRKGLFIAVLIAILALAAAVYFGMAWMSQKNELVSKDEELTTKQNVLEQLQTAEEVDAIAPTTYGDLLVAYNNLIEQASTRYDKATETPKILEALRNHYEVDVLPSETAVLVLYEVVKPDTKPTGQVSALVYYPASESKLATFVEMLKTDEAAEWEFVDYL